MAVRAYSSSQCMHCFFLNCYNGFSMIIPAAFPMQMLSQLSTFCFPFIIVSEQCRSLPVVFAAVLGQMLLLLCSFTFPQAFYPHQEQVTLHSLQRWNETSIACSRPITHGLFLLQMNLG